MPIHDWTRADDGLFHDFHNSWLAHLKDTLNGGLLPDGYFAMLDVRADVYIPDIATLTAHPRESVASPLAVLAEPIAERMVVAQGRRQTHVRRRILVRTARRVVAVIELVSPSNKDGPKQTTTFVAKLVDLIETGIHLVVIDLIPPGTSNPGGLHPLIWASLTAGEPADTPPADRPLSCISYAADESPIAYLNYAAVGQPLPGVPLYLTHSYFVTLPLEETYMWCYDRIPGILKAELE
ncbi:MAG: DUF4058 family protein [Bacteroidales bacterium]|nr:DUF4058 family protein [Bacteroidales bacterium]